MLYNLNFAWALVADFLTDFSNQPDVIRKLQLTFGEGVNIPATLQLISALASGEQQPVVEILPQKDINRANGAFAGATHKIYLAEEFVARHSLEDVATVLLEEVGHYVDFQVNAEDAAGDEGAIFSALVRGESLDAGQLQGLKSEDDSVIITLDGQVIQIEQSTDYIDGFGKTYRTVEKTFSDLSKLASNNSTLATWKDIGNSWDKYTLGGRDGYDISALELTNKSIGQAKDKPTLFLMSGIHARELAPVELLTRFSEKLVNDYGKDSDITWLLDYYRIVIVPIVNPDGRKIAEVQASPNNNGNNSQRKNLNGYDNDNLKRGVDLERNFDFKWGPDEQDSSNNLNDETYRGTEAASEPETKAIQGYVAKLFDDQRGLNDSDLAPANATGLFIDVHSYSNAILLPWGWTAEASPNHTQLQTLGRKFSYFTGTDGQAYDVSQASNLYNTPINGASLDWAYGNLGIAAYGWELGTKFFQDSKYFENTIIPETIPTLLYAAKAARLPYQNPAGPDSFDLHFDLSTSKLTAIADGTRYNDKVPDTNNPALPNIPIMAGRYSIDAPSWLPGTITYSLNATDGVFDTSKEQLNGVIDLKQLRNGRHTIFVESQNNQNQWGVPTSIFIETPELLIFRESDDSDTSGRYLDQDILGWDHVGLTFKGKVYESNAGYPIGNYWDPFDGTGQNVLVSPINGPQNQNTLGSFKFHSQFPTSPSVVDGTDFKEVPIPYSLAKKISELIDIKINNHATFQPIDILDPNTRLPEVQKGGVNEDKFTNVGLIEWAAEKAGHNNGQGFIPNEAEYINITNTPFLSPKLLEFFASRESQNKKYLQGFVDPVDFILTDPQGNRLGYNSQSGFINEIADSFYTGDGASEQFLILDPKPGIYTIQLYGLGKQAFAAVGGSSIDGDSFSGALDVNQTKILTIFVPESYTGTNLCDIIGGLDNLLDNLQKAVNSKVFSLTLPLLGDKVKNSTDEAIHFITKLQTNFITPLNIICEQNGDLNSALVQLAIIEGLGRNGLNILPDFNGDGRIDRNDIKVTENATNLEFNLKLKGTQTLANFTFDKSLGVPALGLGLDIQGGIGLDVGYEFNLIFGVNKDTGFYIDTSKQDELKVSLDAEVNELNASGKLGFLQVDVVQPTAKETGFNLDFAVNLQDSKTDLDEKLTYGEVLSLPLGDLITTKISGSADVNLDLTTHFKGDNAQKFPNLSTEFALNWNFGIDNLFDADTFKLNVNSKPTLAFNNTNLDLGSFISDFAKPVVDKVANILKPLSTPLDTLYKDIDIKVLKFKLIDLAQTLEYITPEQRKVIDSVYQFKTIADQLSGLTEGGNIKIQLGNFDLGKTADISDPTFNFNNFTIPQNIIKLDNLFDAQGDIKENGQLKQADEKTKTFLKSLNKITEKVFQFSLLEDPSRALGLLLGKDVELVTYELPRFVFDFPYSQYFPIIGPLGVRVTGLVGADLNLGHIGFDTYGLRKSQWFEGFYISDTDQFDGTGFDKPELTITAGLEAAAELNLALAKAGVGGGIYANVYLNLHDLNPEGEPEGEPDGKLRPSEITTLLRVSPIPLCLFDLSGDLQAGLNAYVTLGRKPFAITKRWESPRVVIADFYVECDDESHNTPPPVTQPKPILGSLNSSNQLDLHIGAKAALRVNGNIEDGAEIFIVTPGNGKVFVHAFGVKQEFNSTGLTKIVAQGGMKNDVIDLGQRPNSQTPSTVNAGVQIAGELHGGLGDDLIKGGEGNDSIYGDDGNDQLYSGNGNDSSFGGLGNDLIISGKGNDVLYGEDDDDLLDGGEENDSLYGGNGDDWLIGGSGDDIFDGGLGTNTVSYETHTVGVRVDLNNTQNPVSLNNTNHDIEGDHFNLATIQQYAGTNYDDIFLGNSDANTLIGLGGNDTLQGNNGDDILDGGDGNNVLDGGNGDDVLAGGSGGDRLIGGLGNDTVSYESSIEGIVLNLANPSESTKDALGDTFDSVEVLILTYADDHFIGDAQANSVFGRSGNDTLEGGAGNDSLNSEEGNDKLLGGDGADSLDGGDDYDIASYEDSPIGILLDLNNTNNSTGYANGDIFWNIEEFDGSLHNDTMQGDSNANYLDALDGNNTLIGGGGADTLAAGIGNDTYRLDANTAGGSHICDRGGTGDSLELLNLSLTLDRLSRTDNHLIIDLNPTPTANSTNTVTIENFFSPRNLSIDSATVIEGDSGTKKAVFSITLKAANSGKGIGFIETFLSSAGSLSGLQILQSLPAIKVDYQTAPNTALENIDYQFTQGVLTFAYTDTAKTLEIPIIGESLEEDDETFWVNLSNATANITDAQGIGTILNDDTSITISDASRIEGNSGQKLLNFNVHLTKPSHETVTVDYRTVEGTAKAGEDYNFSQNTFVFAPRETVKPITVEILGDTAIEVHETFSISLSNAVHGDLIDNQAIGTIFNDDFPQISINDVTVTEGDTGFVNATFTVHLSEAGKQKLSVNYETVNNSAIAGLDYVPTSGFLSFQPGETNQSLTVNVKGDTLEEFHETFFVQLKDAINGTIADNLGIAKILDNDFRQLSINDVTVKEGDSGNPQAIFTVKLSGVSNRQITVDYETVAALATEGTDYLPLTGTLTFNLGETEKTIAIDILDDAIEDEGNETFFLNLSQPSNALIGDAQGIGTIEDDDVPGISINDVSAIEGDSGNQEFTFTLSLSRPSTQTVSVDYFTSGNIATPDVDYFPTNSRVNFSPGETEKVVTVMVKGDTNIEDNERFFVNLTNSQNATIDDNQGVGTILNDDESNPLIINLKTGAITGLPNPYISLVSSPTDSNSDGYYEAVIKLNYAGALDKAKFIIDYDALPTGWTVDIGDSISNDGFGGDRGHTSNAAEMQILGTKMDVYSNTLPGYQSVVDSSGELHILGVNNLVDAGSQVVLQVEDERLSWNNQQGINGSFTSPYLYTLNGQLTAYGLIDYDLYASFNRVINENSRIGSGASQITIISVNTGKQTVQLGAGQVVENINFGNNFVKVGIISGNVKENIDNNNTGEVNLSGVAISSNTPSPQIATFSIDKIANLAIVRGASSYFLTTATTWIDAQAQARSMGGNLVTINSAEENQFLVDSFGGSELFWTGFNDANTEGNFQWVNGESVIYTNWLFGEPNNYGGNEDYTVTNWNNPGFWNDLPNDVGGIRGIVEVNQGILAFTNSQFSINEDGTPVVAVTVNRTGNITGSASIRVNLTNGTAEAELDFSATSQLVQFNPGETSKIIPLPIIDDRLVEGNEDLFLTLTDITGADIGAQDVAQVILLDNDTQVEFSQAIYNLNEDGTPNGVVITLDRTGNLDRDSSVQVDFTDATATGGTPSVIVVPTTNPDDNPLALRFADGVDHDHTTRTIFFSRGETSQTLLLPIDQDTLLEGTESFTLALHQPSDGTTIGSQNLATVNVIDDEPSQISGSTWIDRNADGNWNLGERADSRTTVYLDQNNNRQQDTGELATLTDSNGFYEFKAVAPGRYTVREPEGNRASSVTLEISRGQIIADINLSRSLDLFLDNQAIAERRPLGTPIGTFSLSDTDPTQTYTYSLIGGVGDTDNAQFTLVGDRLKTNAVFDYETKNTYNIRLQASDNNGGILQKQFSINITDINEINGTPARDTLTGTPNADIITGFQSADILTGGNGNDRFFYTSLIDAGDTIKDFAIGQDQIVLTQLLTGLGYQGSNPIIDGYVRFLAQGSSTFVQIDPDGLAGSGTSRSFIFVENLSLNALNTPSNFVF